MQEAFGVLIFAVVAIAGVVALITFVISRKAYDDSGRGAFAMRDEVPPRRANGRGRGRLCHAPGAL